MPDSNRDIYGHPPVRRNERGRAARSTSLEQVALADRDRTIWTEIWSAIAHQYPTRSILGFRTQAFLYNAIFFTYALILVQVLSDFC